MIAIATGAREKRTIAMTNLATSRTGLAGVIGNDKGHCNAFLKSFIADKALKLREWPGLVDIPLPLTHFGSLPDMFKVFHYQNVIRADAFNYSLADNVVEVADYPALLARKPLQEPSNPSSAFGLERSSQIRKMPPYMHCLLPREFEAIRSGGDIVDAQVYSNRISPLRSRNWSGEDDVNIEAPLPFRFAIDQSRRSGFLAFKQMPLVIPQDKGNLNSAVYRRKRHHFFGGNKAEYPLVITYRCGLKLSNLPHFSFRRFGDSGNGTYRQIGRKVVSLFKVIIAMMLELNFIGCPVLFGYLQDMIASSSKALECSPKCLSLLRGSIQFTRDCFNKLHSGINYITLGKSLSRKEACANSSPA